MPAPQNKRPSKDYDAKEDFPWFIRMISHLNPLWLIGVVSIAVGAIIPVACKSNGRASTVIAYVSQDQVYAELIFKEFERETGIRVRSIFDSEAAKTVGLVNRLLAERARPQCDVYWGGEELRTRQLAAQGVFRETKGWVAFGHRSRRIAVSAERTNFPPPASLLELTNERYRGRVVLSLPLFGTTATHFTALRQHWGAAGWEQWCRALVANKPFVVDGNSVAAQFVVRGEADVALTDSDDIAAVNRDGVKLRTLPLTAESLLIPNTVAVIRNCPHPDAAQRLFEFLQRRTVADQLVAAGALESATSGAHTNATLQPDWPALLRDLDATTAQLQAIFRR